MRYPLNTRKNTVLLLSAAMMSLTACNGSNASNDSDANSNKLDTSMLEEASSIDPTNVAQKKGVNEKMTKEDQIKFAKEHLANKLSVDISTISLAGAESVTWRSSAMGCPEPDTAYMQALVPGMLIMLKSGDKAYRYHASTDASPAYCPNSRAESPSASPGDI